MIREVKRIGGLDTVGVECGDGIERRVRSELGAVLGPKRADEMLSIPIDINDTDQPWWTPMSSHESEREQQDRVNEFLNYSRYCDAKIPVFVGHSLFFRAFYSKRVSSQLFQNRRHLSEQLKRFRLSNASMLAVTVAYQEKEGGYSDAVMIDADLIFGGGFHGATKDHDGGHAHDNSSILAQLSTSPGANTVFSNLNIPGFAANISQDLKQKKDQLSKGVKMFSEKIYDIFEK